MPHPVTQHLMVGGNAEQTNKFDVSLIEAANIGRLERYGPGEPGAEGSVKQANSPR